MAGLADWLEDYRNWRGRQEWEQGKGWQDFFGGDPRAQEQFEKLSGFGTDAGGLVGMIKASHGSPHAFTKFDFSKIGTGEGAQVYGHGGYFAQGFDSPVAMRYQPRDPKMEEILMKEYSKAEKKFDYPAMQIYEDYLLHKSPLEVEDSLKEAGFEGNDLASALRAHEFSKKQYHDQRAGALYNVEPKWPDAAREAADPLGEHHLLDWDAPLKEQPTGILKALKKSDFYKGAKEKYKTTKEWYHNPDTKTGESFYKYIQSGLSDDVREGGMSPVEASEYLRSLGIPGIRYLDQASRGAGEGTRNYVMFDDAFPNIVSRNGVSLSDLLRR